MWNPFHLPLVHKKAPAITGDGWINITSLPQNIREEVMSTKKLEFYPALQNTVVLVYFWDYTNPNSLQDIPRMRALWEEYEGKGFLIIGVHTPQLELAVDQDKVQGAALRFDLDFPIVNDSSYKTWKRYGNTVWPRKLLVDAYGIIQYDTRGEGQFDELEEKIRSILSPLRETKLFPATDDNTKTPDVMFTQESASQQGIAASPPTQAAQYHLQFKLPIHHWGLSGWWILQHDKIVSGKMGDDQACVVHFLGSAITLAGHSKDSAALEVLINSRPIPEHMRGRDIVVQNDRTYIHIKEDRGYSLAQNMPYGKYIVSLIPTTSGLNLEGCLFS
jgi:hypothetical protein